LKSIYLSPQDKPSQKASGLDVSVPRVLNKTTNRLRTILEENEIYPNGTEIMEKINSFPAMGFRAYFLLVKTMR
jgi:hypothetical protein